MTKIRIGLAAPEDTLNLDMLDDEKPPGTYYIKARHPGIDEDEIASAAVGWGGQQTEEGGVTFTGDIRVVGGFIAKCVVQIRGFCLPRAVAFSSSK